MRFVSFNNKTVFPYSNMPDLDSIFGNHGEKIIFDTSLFWTFKQKALHHLENRKTKTKANKNSDARTIKYNTIKIKIRQR